MLVSSFVDQDLLASMFPPIRLCALAAALVLTTIRAGVALDRDLGIAQLQHTSWTIGEGAPPDIWALTQSRDGYLWLGTGVGLYRFDGVNFERIHPTNQVDFTSLDITAVTACPSGDIWFAYFDGGVGWIRKGNLTNFGRRSGIPVGRIYSVACDQREQIWVASLHGLYRYDRVSWKLIDKNWNYPADCADYLLLSRDGTLWVTTGKELVYLRPGEKRFRSAVESLSALTPLAEAPDGSIWISDDSRGVFPIARIAGGRLRLLQVPATTASNEGLRAKRLLFDRDGVLWATDRIRGGIFRVDRPNRLVGPVQPRDVTDRFSQSAGLASDIAVPLLEDSENDIWVGTNLGLDRFRQTDFHSVAGIPAISNGGFSIAAAADGSLLVSNTETMFQATGDRTAEVIARAPENSIDEYQSPHGYTWYTVRDPETGRISLVQQDRSSSRTIRAPARYQSTRLAVIGEMPDGSTLVRFDYSSIWLFRHGNWLSQPFGHALPNALPWANSISPQGQLCLGFGQNLLSCLQDGHSQNFTQHDGLTIGAVTALYKDDSGLLLGGEFGIGELTHGRIWTIAASRVPAFTGVSGITKSRDGAMWFNGMFGVLRITPEELDRAFRDNNYQPKYRLFDYHDGVVGTAEQADETGTAAATADGRLWFVTNHGIVTTNPARFIAKPRPPPVAIALLTADGKTFADADPALPAGLRNLRIDYTALSLSAPERLRFFYKLEGFDGSWIEAGNRRQAFYTNLAPGRYRFVLTAANGDGTRNPVSAAITFTIPPTFVQSWVFFFLSVITMAALLWALYSYRLNQMASRVRSGLEERLRERERIARELHDTLLQGVHGLIMRFQAIMQQMPAGSPLHSQMELALDRADNVMFDGRDRVKNLRLADQSSDIACYFENIAEEFATDHPSAFRLVVEGMPRRLHAVVSDELRWIGREALFNAFHHARARMIEVEIGYHWAAMRLRIRDDGTGLPGDVLVAGHKDGHFGLVGMRERAERIHAKFVLLSTPGAGTELSVTVCPNVAYASYRRNSAWRRLRELLIGETAS